VPTIKDIGLWGPKVQGAFADMGILDLATLDVEAQFAADKRGGAALRRANGAPPAP